MLKTLCLSEAAQQYIQTHHTPETAALKQLYQAFSHLPGFSKNTPPEETQLLTLLAQLMQAERVLEVGTFLGYTALALAQVIPDTGYVITCDIDDTFPQQGRPFWKAAGVDHKIDFRLGPALDTLRSLIEHGLSDTFDLIYIDADKTQYPDYFECAVHLVRAHGLIAIDNTLGVTGAAVFEEPPAPKQRALISTLRDFNGALQQDPRVIVNILPIACGLTLALKK